MRDYGPPPGNQMELTIPGVNDEAHEEFERVRKWTCTIFNEWCDYKRIVRSEMAESPDRKASPNEVFRIFKRKYKLSIPNHWATILARIAKQECPDLEFRFAKSMYDPCVEVRL